MKYKVILGGVVMPDGKVENEGYVFDAEAVGMDPATVTHYLFVKKIVALSAEKVAAEPQTKMADEAQKKKGK